MAIKVEFYSLITTVENGKKYFPEQYADKDFCWNDGFICRPMGAMSPMHLSSIIEDCETMGLKRFREESGKKVIGDYFIASQFGLDNTLTYPPCDWIRVYNGVAWHPSFPMDKDIPKFPCYRGGFYYKSKDVWDTAVQALESYDKVIDAYYAGEAKKEKKEGVFIPSVKATPFGGFFEDLAMQTMEQQLFENEIKEYEKYNLRRFVDAHRQMYSTALAEIRSGKKQSHWMWYIFPQLKGLGHSANSDYYGIVNCDEAMMFLHHPELGRNLREITEAMLAVDGKSAQEILGDIDALKFYSSMTLFDVICHDDIFAKTIQKYFNGKRDEQTLERLNIKGTLRELFLNL